MKRRKKTVQNIKKKLPYIKQNRNAYAISQFIPQQILHPLPQ